MTPITGKVQEVSKFVIADWNVDIFDSKTSLVRIVLEKFIELLMAGWQALGNVPIGPRFDGKFLPK